MHTKILTRLVQGLSPKDRPYEIFDTQLTGFLLRVQPTGVMTYYLAYKTADGQGKRFRIGRADALTVAQARDIATQYAAQLMQGVDIQSARQLERQQAQHARLRTFHGFLEDKYGPWVVAERKTGAATLARLRHNFGALGDTALHDITPWLLEKWRSEQLKRGKARSTANRDITALKAVLSKAVDWGILDKHPLTKLKPFKLDTKGVVRYLSEEEERGLRHALAQRDTQIKAARDRGNTWRRERGHTEMPSFSTHTYGDHLTPMVLLSLNTGLRRGEIFRLRWTDINVPMHTLSVQGATAKSGQTRHIPLNREALEVVQAWRQQSAPDTALVFPSKNGEPFDNTRKAWDGVLHAANLTDFRWHDLRHTFASKLVMAGVPLNTVRELLGHASPTMTLRYAHLAPDHKAEAVSRLSPPVICAHHALEESRG